MGRRGGSPRAGATAAGAAPRPPSGTGPVAQPTQFGDDQVQALTLDELHGIEADIAVLADLVDRHDVGVVQLGRGAGLAAEPLADRPVAGRLPRQNLQRHAAAQRDLLGLVDHAHAAAADLAHDPVIAELSEKRGGGLPRVRVIADVPLDLFDLNQGREHLPDLVGHLGQAVNILLQARPLAQAIPLDELLGQLVEPPIFAGTEFRGHGQGPSRPTLQGRQEVFEPLQCAEIPLRPGIRTDPEYHRRLGEAELFEVSQRQHLAVNRIEAIQGRLDPQQPLGPLAAWVGEVSRPRSIEPARRSWPGAGHPGRARSPARRPASWSPGVGDAASSAAARRAAQPQQRGKFRIGQVGVEVARDVEERLLDDIRRVEPGRAAEGRSATPPCAGAAGDAVRTGSPAPGSRSRAATRSGRRCCQVSCS